MNYAKIPYKSTIHLPRGTSTRLKVYGMYTLEQKEDKHFLYNGRVYNLFRQQCQRSRSICRYNWIKEGESSNSLATWAKCKALHLLVRNAESNVGRQSLSHHNVPKHEKGEDEMERCDTCAKNLFHELEPCVYVQTHEDVRMCADRLCNRKNVRATGECMYTHRRTHCSCHYMCTKPFKKLCRENSVKKQKLTFITSWPSWQKKIFNSSSGFGTLEKILRVHHSMSVLIFLAGTCYISWLFISRCEWRLLGFPRHASRRDRPS